jgi:hypothetical protein
LGSTDTGTETLADARTSKNGRHWLTGLLPQSVFGRLAGYEDVNDAGRLCRDPAMRWVVGDRAVTGGAARAGMTRARVQMLQPTRGETCADVGKHGAFCVSEPTIASFDRRLPAATVFALAQAVHRPHPALETAGNLANVG